MKQLLIDDELYAYIASHTQHIGESASDILRRLLNLTDEQLSPQTEEQAFPKSKVAEHSGAKVFDRLTQADLTAQKGKVGQFLYILSMLHACHPNEFPQVLNIRGRDRLYFATNEAELSKTGNSTNPKQIPGSGFWVITNSNTTKKKSMLTRVAETLGYTVSEQEQIRNFLS
ncbi:MAG: negative modulator of initiation of replication SeqA [Idiomarinaceae bacterium HL-53]|nr:MAG: negative modulator of initiation of replication SeqA [Idiomarinaceae bacterium HL-53]CUS49242.1 negative regulator of replication initiation SeqA [Idiomarinaceae bacterium HL-53]